MFSPLCLGLLVIIGSVCANPLSPRVVNGTDTDIAQWPYVVSLRRNHYHSCGGTALNPYWILTAAHCTQSNDLASYSIRHSSTNVASGSDAGHVVRVAQIVNHVNYNASDRYIHDISLIRLAEPIFLTSYSRLPEQFVDVAQDTPAKLIGWGLNETGGSIQSILQEVELIVFSDEECIARHNVSRPHQSNICGGVPQGGMGQCSGDSGGPLVVNGVEVGIVSWSVKPCAVYPYPGVYTQVSYYREWIRWITGV